MTPLFWLVKISVVGFFVCLMTFIFMRFVAVAEEDFDFMFSKKTRRQSWWFVLAALVFLLLDVLFVLVGLLEIKI